MGRGSVGGGARSAAEQGACEKTERGVDRCGAQQQRTRAERERGRAAGDHASHARSLPHQRRDEGWSAHALATTIPRTRLRPARALRVLGRCARRGIAVPAMAGSAGGVGALPSRAGAGVGSARARPWAGWVLGAARRRYSSVRGPNETPATHRAPWSRHASVSSCVRARDCWGGCSLRPPATVRSAVRRQAQPTAARAAPSEHVSGGRHRQRVVLAQRGADHAESALGEAPHQGRHRDVASVPEPELALAVWRRGGRAEG